MRKTIFFILAILLLYIISVNHFYQLNHLIKEDKVENDPLITTATISAIGDVLIHNRVYEPAYIGNNKYNFMPNFIQVQPFLQKADITIANQESMIGGTDIRLSSYPSFNSPFEVGNALKESGVDLVTIANNHTLDRGEKAIDKAITHWKEIGMVYTGAYQSENDQQNIRIIEKNGISFSFLAYTYGTNGVTIPKEKPFLVNLINDEVIKKDIRKAKKVSDIVVINLHFGNEYEQLPNEEQKKLVRLVALEGADIILGHHPHVLQPVEWIERPDGSRAFVAYSLGNFLSGQKGDYKDIGGMIQLKVVKSGDGNEKVIVKEPAFLLTYVDEEYKVVPFIRVKGKELEYKKMKQHVKQWLPELKFFLE